MKFVIAFTFNLFNYILILVSLTVIRCFESPRVETTSGFVQGTSIGVNNGFVDQFLNIPYAEPPLGNLRFSKPVPLRNTKKGVIDGTKIGNACLQSKVIYDIPVQQSEDCLVLNVWTKRDNNISKAVMVWFHGGGFAWGTIFQTLFNGSELSGYDVVVVTVNYRLGLFGFLYGGSDSAPGNVGLYDQRLALQWVKNNIQYFGGDPKQVTIFGESAGGRSVTAHLLSPLTSGLYKRAIPQSGALLQNIKTPDLPKDQAYKEARTMAEHFNCNDNNQWLNCLRSVDANDLNSYKNLSIGEIYGTEYLPFPAQQALRSGQFNRGIDVMIGYLQDEGPLITTWNYRNFSRLFLTTSETVHSVEDFKTLLRQTPYPNLDSNKIASFYLRNQSTTDTDELKFGFYGFIGDIQVNCRTYLFAKEFARYSPKSKVYFYYWTYVSSYFSSLLGCIEEMGVCHQSEIPYIFGEAVRRNMTDQSFSKYSMKIWSNFAKYGDPLNGFPPGYNWPRFSNANDHSTSTKEINPFRLNNNIDSSFANNCEGFWKNYFI